MLEFGMPTLIENCTLEENVSLCRELGLDFIELNMNLPQYQIEQLEHADYFEKIASDNGIYFTVHLDENLNIADFNHGVAAAYTDTVLRLIDVAKKLHIPVLNMHMNHGVYFTLPGRKVHLFEQYRNEYEEAWRLFREKCIERVDGAPLKICIENTDGYRNYEVEAVRYLLESDVFGLTWDIGHCHVAGNTDEPFLREYEDKLAHFHIHDGMGSLDHMTLGSGQIDLRGRLEIAMHHKCRCVIETKTVEALRDSMRWLKERRINRGAY